MGKNCSTLSRSRPVLLLYVRFVVGGVAGVATLYTVAVWLQQYTRHTQYVDTEGLGLCTLRVDFLF